MSRDVILRTAAKATAAFVVTGVGAIAVGYADGVMTAAEWWSAAAAACTTALGVYTVPNRPPADG